MKERERNKFPRNSRRAIFRGNPVITGQRKRGELRRFRSTPSFTAAPFTIDTAVQVGHFTLRGGKELLQLVLKSLVTGRRQGSLGDFAAAAFGRGCRPGTARPSGSGFGTGKAPSGPWTAASAWAARLTLFRRRFFDREIDSSIFGGEDQDLDGLPRLEKIMHVFYEGIGDFRDMYQSGTASLQRDECAKLGDRSNFAFQNAPNLRLHTVSCFSFR